MAFVMNNDSLIRRGIVGFYQDATAQGAATTKYRYGYVSADAAATVEAAGYFDAATTLLNPGDTIDAVMAVGGTPVLKSYVVTSNAVATGGHVVIALQTTTAG
jgi:hypothetical protein